jgi:hypothetical protein
MQQTRLEKLDVDILNKVVPTINWKAYVKEKYFFDSLGYLFQVLAGQETKISLSLRQEMLDLANGNMIAGIMHKQDLMSIFLYLWNTYALFISMEDKRQFNHWLNPTIMEGILKVSKRIKTCGPLTRNMNTC